MKRSSSGRNSRPSAQGRNSSPSRQPRAAGPVNRSRDPEVPRNWRIIPGFHAIEEALKVRPRGVKMIWLREGWESSQELQNIQKKCLQLKAKIESKPLSILDRMCATHQGAILFVDGKPELNAKALAEKEKSILVILDGIEDPHNLGAILRTSWLIGADGLFIPQDRAVGLTPTAHKVACGGAEHVPVEEVTNFGPTVEQLKKDGYWVFGLSHKSDKTIFDVRIPEKIVWAIGSEDKGLRTSTERLCDELVRIPQLSAAASYNASVAAAMALMESHRQHSTQHENSKKSEGVK